MNNQFEKWIRESGPGVLVNEVKKEAHLAVLQERLRIREARHRIRSKRRLRASMVAVVLLISMIGGNLSELGGDGFDMEIISDPLTGRKWAVSGMRQTIVGIDEDYTETNVVDLHQQGAARSGNPIGMWAMSVEGVKNWSILYEVDVAGETIILTQAVLDRPIGMSRNKLLLTQSPEWIEFEDSVKSGQIAHAGLSVEVLDGIRFKVRKYLYQSQDFGEVLYWRGEPIR